MGIISGGIAIAKGLAGLFGFGAKVATKIAPRALGLAARAAPSVALGAAGAFLGAGLAGAGDAGLGAAIEAQGGAVIRPLSGGRVLVQTPDGGIGIVTRAGRLINPTVLIPAGSPVPPGGTLVSMSADGSLIGFTIRRKRRPFASELRRVRSVLSSVRSLHNAMMPKKRRSS